MNKKEYTNHTNNTDSGIPELDLIDLDVEDLDDMNFNVVNDDTGIAGADSDDINTNAADLDDINFEAIDLEAVNSDFTEPAQNASASGYPAQNTAPELLQEEEDLLNDWKIDDDDDWDEEEPGFFRKLFKSHAIWHILFFLALILIFFLVYNRIMNYGKWDNLDNYEGNYDLENYDNILPLFEDESPEAASDGITTIVAFGNAPFADDRDSKNSLAGIIEAKTGATVYNCSVPGSLLAAVDADLSVEADPMVAFNFYWMTTAFCLRNNVLNTYNEILTQHAAELPAEGIEAFNTLMSIDFNKVDVITIMYDGSDYLTGQGMYNDENDTDIYHFTGNLEAGLELIQETYPHIRIIVMSPTYAFAINEEGEYVSSDQYRYGQDVLSTYVIRQAFSCYSREVTFVDNLYGTINEDNATKYLTDHIHLNEAGRELVADRFIYALEYYDKAAESQEK